MKKLLIVVTTIAVFLSLTPAAWAEDFVADTPYQPYEFKSTKPWGVIISDNGKGFCRIFLTLSRVESSFISMDYFEGSGASPDNYLGMMPGGDYIKLQNPLQISSWLVYGIEKWQSDNPQKETQSIHFINTAIAITEWQKISVAPTTACIIHYK
ncbi:hypothetical protein E3J85_02435 [Patescibacteria group bacterium]|nr:MAG: hypothetical protein E3J85_02435 [Patescibacteria group bacterium]